MKQSKSRSIGAALMISIAAALMFVPVTTPSAKAQTYYGSAVYTNNYYVGNAYAGSTYISTYSWYGDSTANFYYSNWAAAGVQITQDLNNGMTYVYAPGGLCSDGSANVTPCREQY